MSRTDDSLVVCEQCGQAHRWVVPTPGAVAKCVRCGVVIGRGHRFGSEAMLAMTTTALIVFLIAISTNVLSVRLGGAVVTATLPNAVATAWLEGERLVAMAVAVTTLVAPALFIGLRLYVLIPLAAGRRPRGFAVCVRVLHQAARWNMVEVFTIGALLSLVRLTGLADASPGPGLLAIGVLAMLLAAVESAGLKHLWWDIR